MKAESKVPKKQTKAKHKPQEPTRQWPTLDDVAFAERFPYFDEFLSTHGHVVSEYDRLAARVFSLAHPPPVGVSATAYWVSVSQALGAATAVVQARRALSEAACKMSYAMEALGKNTGARAPEEPNARAARLGDIERMLEKLSPWK